MSHMDPRDPMSLIMKTSALQKMTPERQFMDYREKESAIAKKLALQKKVYDNLMQFHSIEAISIFMEHEAQEIKENPFMYRIMTEDIDLLSSSSNEKTMTSGNIKITFQWFPSKEGKKVYHIDEICYCLFSTRDLLRIHKDKGMFYSSSSS